MSRRASSREDWGKGPMYATSQRDNSSNDETALASKQVAQVLQSHFNCGGDDPWPTSGIPMETRSRRRCSDEMASVSFKSHTISSGAISRRRLVRRRGGSEGEVKAEDILIDIDDNFPGPKVLLEFGTWRRNLRQRFPPHQTGVDARP